LVSTSALPDELLAWYADRKRPLPWRRNSDPYAVWVSEIMLQQTTVAAVIPFFERWMTRFPTVASLAEAEIDEVLRYWQGLGYYRRAKLLHKAAHVVSATGCPTDRAGWEALPGVGAYTAGAVLSIAFGVPEPAVDGNVERVYARFMGDRSAKPALTKSAQEWMASWLRPEAPGDSVQATMELGATVCTPRQPKCPECPLQGACYARRHELVAELPTPSTRPQFSDKTLYLGVPVRGDLLGWNRLAEDEWGAGLFGFVRLPEPASEPIGTVRHTITRYRIRAEIFLLPGADAERWSADAAELAITALDAKAMDLIRKRRFARPR